MKEIKSYARKVFLLAMAGALLSTPTALLLFVAWLAIGIGKPEPLQVAGAVYAVFLAITFVRYCFTVRVT